MRRRVTLAVVAVAVAAVLLTAVGTILLTRHRARAAATSELSDEAAALVPFVTGADDPGAAVVEPNGTILVRRVRAARQALGLLDASVLVVDASGGVVSGDVPEGVPAGVATSVSGAGATISGVHGQVAWAAASSASGRAGRHLTVVLTRELPLTSGVLPWVAVSGIVAVVLAVAAATVIARRVTGPLVTIGGATRRIASGELDARVGDLGGRADAETVALAESIDTMAAALEHARSSQRAFLLSVSHDLRTPLTSIRGYAEAIVDDAVPEPKRAAAVILTESTRLGRLVSDLLDLTRMEAHQFTLEAGPVDIVAAARAAVAEGAPVATAAGIAVELLGVDEQIVVSADADRLGQVLANLIENAVRYASARVRVDVRDVGDEVRVTVTDDGPGIAPEDLDRVFDRFVADRPAAGTARNRPRGSGLGLTISRELVVAMGGSLVAGPGGGPDRAGTTMTVRLPIVRQVG